MDRSPGCGQSDHAGSAREACGLALVSASSLQRGFLAHDSAGMEREAANAIAKPGVDDQILFLESETAADGGEFSKSRELSRRASDSAQRIGEQETAAEYLG